MTCNITERFSRIVAGTTLFVLLTAFNTAWTAEFEVDSKTSAHLRSEIVADRSGENQSTDTAAESENESEDTASSDASTGSNASIESNATTDSNVSSDGAATDGNISSNSNANGSAQVNPTAPDAKPLVRNAEALADATYHFVDDINATAQDAVAETVAQEIGAAVGASVEEDVRANVQEDMQAELTRSLPLPGQD